ncbi:hypothetical protein [Methylobacterium gossipiicola]|uniref:Uncharacterized protein n=1 Tax=Methylobacterium gossipiicola TaxID=582675 RepID=A0A1I2WMB2_9HYPH|nr:hypothetical protein [Methylobacterium gossipiicola]SFH01879.1 hypothetical protein SAMN05192565_12443 [Methylobacterium gossipiicola]
MDADYKARQEEYGAGYEGGEPREMNDLIVATGEWLEKLVWSPTAADAAMKALYAEIVGSEDIDADPSASWRDLWRDGVERHWDSVTLQVVIELHAFAFWGLRPDLNFLEVQESDSLAASIERTIAKLRALLDAAPPGWANLAEIERTVAAAEARIRLDTGHDVTLEQLAALAEVSVKSMKNLLAPKGGSGDLKLDAKDEIARSAALHWLGQRPKFKSSLWNAAGDLPDTSSASEEPLDEVVFVPVAKDGSCFDPATCRTSRGYTIGAKGAEIHVSDYREALDQLARMKTPRWRRLNAAGGWGLVTGTTWQRRELRELALLKSPYAGSASA